MIPRKWQAALLGGLFVILLLVVLRGGKPSGANAPESRGPGADPEAGTSFGKRRDAKISPEDVPDIDSGAFSGRTLRVAEASRDLFKFREPPPPPKKVVVLPPPYIPPSDPRFNGPRLPPPPPPPPTPPPIPFQFTGSFGPAKQPIGVIVEGDRLSVVQRGDVIDKKFIIRNVGYESLDVGFVGFPESEVRRLPLTPKT